MILQSTDYRNNDVKLLRVMCLLVMIGAPIFSLVWSYTFDNITLHDAWIKILDGLLYSFVALLILILTSVFKIIKNNAYYINYGMFLAVTVAFVRVVEDNEFSIQALFLLIMLSTITNMIVKKLIHLVLFDIVVLSELAIALYKVNPVHITKEFLVFFFFFYFIMNLCLIHMKLRAQRTLVRSEKIYRGLIETTPQAVVVVRDNEIGYSNAAAVDMFAASDSRDLRGRNINELIQGIICSEVNEEDYIRNHCEGILTRLDGTETEIEADRESLDIDKEHAVMYLIRDISERKASEKKIKRMAYYDPLTGLPNRYHIHQILGGIINDKENNSHQSIILFMDLDGFKTVNDTMGHLVGDQLLKLVAQRLLQCVRNDDVVARYGGDEFVMLLSGSSRAVGYAVSNRIIHAFSQPFRIEGTELFITPSIGISFYPHDGSSVESLIRNADIAMYQAKKSGKNRFEYYSPEIGTTIKEPSPEV